MARDWNELAKDQYSKKRSWRDWQLNSEVTQDGKIGEGTENSLPSGRNRHPRLFFAQEKENVEKEPKKEVEKGKSR